MLSLCTLLYSFVLSKHDTLLTIAKEIKSKGTEQNPLLKKEEARALKYIRSMRILNIKCFGIFIINVVVGLISWVAFRLLNNECVVVKQLIMIVLAFITLIVCVYAVVQFIAICINYKRELKTE